MMNDPNNGNDEFEALQMKLHTASTETEALLDRVHSAEDDDERLDLLNQANATMKEATDRLIAFAVQTGLWKIRPLTREQIKQNYLAFLPPNDPTLAKLTVDERLRALFAAKVLKEGEPRHFARCLKRGESAHFLRAVVVYRDMLDAIETSKGHQGLPRARLNIVAAYFETRAWNTKRNSPTQMQFPTRAEVQRQQIELFGSANTKEAIRQTLNQLGLPWRKDNTGRPKGSKDRIPRKKPQQKKSKGF